jgi:hypothetical protein
MKRVNVVVMGVTAAFLLACGGAGEGSSTSGGGNPVAGPNTVVEAVLAPGGVLPGDPSAYVYVDPLNIQVSQNVVFQLASYNGNVRTVLPGTQWRSSDDSGSFGSLGDVTGLYQAGNIVTTTSLFMGTRYDGVDYYAAYKINPAQGVIVGQIVDDSTGLPLRGVRLEFFNDIGVRVGSVSQPFQGQFRASVPTNASQFTVTSDSLPSGYQRVYTFDGRGYRNDDPGCNSSLPTVLVSGISIGQIRIPTNTSPEPTLDGCS